MNQPAGNSPQSDGAAQSTPLSLLERARSHDAQAWQRLVELYRPLVLFWCKRGGVDTSDAEDVAQEVFVAVSAALGRFRRDRPGDTFRGWLRVITRNEVLQLLRRRRGKAQAEGGSDAWHDLQAIADPLPGPDEEELREIDQINLCALDLVRGEFKEQTWQMFWMTVVEDRDPAMVAQELNTTVNNVRQAKSRVLRRLREEVGDLLD